MQENILWVIFDDIIEGGEVWGSVVSRTID